MLLLIPSVIQLVHRHSLDQLPAMVYRIQNGLRMLTEQFYKKVTTARADKEFIFPRDGPSRRIEIPYVYLMPWFAIHCPVQIQLGEEALEGVCFAHLCYFENFQWEGKYLVGVWRPNVKICIVYFGASHISRAPNMARSFEMLETIVLH